MIFKSEKRSHKIYYYSAHDSSLNAFFVAFDLIDESVKALADEIVELKNYKNISGEEAVLVELDEEDNLEFLRE